MTDRSSAEIWGLTKRFNCMKTKWNGKDYSWSPFSLNGRHCASQSANQVGVSVRQDKTTKNFRRTFTITLKKAGKNGIAKRKTKSQGNPATSIIDIREPNKAAKAIEAIKFLSDAEKKCALRKLAACTASTRSAVRGASKAQ